LAHLADAARVLPFPLLAANLEHSHFSPTAVVGTGRYAVGVIGATCRDPALLPPAALDERPLASLVAEGAHHLRSDGVDLVVLAVHDGVDLVPGDRPDGVDPSRLERLCQEVHGLVDLVVAGHTLGHWVGWLAGVPVLQPWSYGYELGVCDFGGAGAELQAVAVAKGPPWQGAHAGLLEEARRENVGVVGSALSAGPGGARSLQDFLATCLARANGTEAGLLPANALVMQQPPVDGLLGYLPPGPLSAAELERLSPWADDGALIASVEQDDLDLMARALSTEWGPCGVSQEEVATGRWLSVCVPGYFVHQFGPALGDAHEWQPAAAGVRDAVRTVLAQAGNDRSRA
jgi:hypothetical protein